MSSKQWQKLCVMIAVLFGAGHMYLFSKSLQQHGRSMKRESIVTHLVDKYHRLKLKKNDQQESLSSTNLAVKKRLLPKSVSNYVDDIKPRNETNTRKSYDTRNPQNITTQNEYNKHYKGKNNFKKQQIYSSRKPEVSRKPNVTNATMVIIMAYIRSGSSFTGDILQQDPDSFYVYEPLHYTEKHWNKTEVLQLNGHVSFMNRNHFYERARAIIDGYLTCQLGALDFGTIVHGFQTFGNKTNEFIKCFQNILRTNRNRWWAAVTCSKELEKICSESKFRIIKTIRLPMSYLKTMMETYKNLKIIHLVRDPRAQIFSIVKISKTNKNNVRFAKHKCKQMGLDFTEAESIGQKFPDRLLRVYYEDLASYPIEMSRVLYKFTGMNFTKQIEKYIHGITDSGGEDNCSICSKRGNSSDHVDKWRTEMSFSDVNVLDNICHNIYDQYGFYPALNERTLKNIDISLRKKLF